MGRQDILGPGHRRCLACLRIDGLNDLDLRKLRAQLLFESLLAFHGGRTARHESDQRHFSLVADQLGQLPRRHPPAFAIVRRHVGDPLRRIQIGIENGNRDAGFHRTFHRCNQRLVVHRRQYDARQMPVDHRIDNADLAARVNFQRRRVPFNVESKFAPGLDRARMHGLPENVACTLRHHAHQGLGLRLL